MCHRLIKDVKFSVLRKGTTKEHLQGSGGGGQEVEGNNRNTVKSIVGKNTGPRWNTFLNKALACWAGYNLGVRCKSQERLKSTCLIWMILNFSDHKTKTNWKYRSETYLKNFLYFLSRLILVLRAEAAWCNPEIGPFPPDVRVAVGRPSSQAVLLHTWMK